MQSARISTALWLGLLTGLSGCYSHYGYSPYGGYPYGPGAYPPGSSPGGFPPGSYPPGGSISPSNPYVPYGSPGTSPTPLAPPSGSQPIWNPAPNNSPLPGNPNTAPPYEPRSGGTGDRPVPNPTNDEEGFGPKPGAGITPGSSPLGSNSGVELQPIESGPLLSPGAQAPSSTVATNDPFDSPLRTVSNGTTVAARSTGLSATNDGRKPFGYDLRNYTWLRGYVDYDQQDQRWIMIYSATPDSGDRFGGSLTLADHKLLARIKPNDHVLIEGAVDETSFDQHGKPLYRIDKMVRLK